MDVVPELEQFLRLLERRSPEGGPVVPVAEAHEEITRGQSLALVAWTRIVMSGPLTALELRQWTANAVAEVPDPIEYLSEAVDVVLDSPIAGSSEQRQVLGMLCSMRRVAMEIQAARATRA